jgi:large subunit ribosomal protein L6
MSRIGKQTIEIPSGVEVTLTDQMIKVKGPKGELSWQIPDSIVVELEESILKVKRSGDEPHERSLHGLSRALISNMVHGVSKGFERRMEIIGVGYRAQVSGKKLTLNLGFSHPVELEIPEGLSAEMDKEQKNTLIVSGIDKQLVGQFAANIRSYRPPEPYKGKGIRYVDEYVARKAGKAAGKEK